MIQAIIFDCFGVLTADSWRAFCDNLPKTVDVGYARNLNHQMDAGLLSREDFAIQVGQITDNKPEDILALISNERSKNTELLNYIEELKSKYKIGLLSNVSSNWIKDTFLTEKEQALFDQMVFSYEVGMTKPDTRIFELVCERLGVEPQASVMIDDILHYCEAAKSIGMQAVNYSSFTKFRSDLESILSRA